MSASRPSDHTTDDSNRWLTIAAVIALVYALGVIGVGSIGTALNASHSIAHWVGRTGSLAVIVGVLLHQHAASVAHAGKRAGERADEKIVQRNWKVGVAPWTIATGLVAIMTGFALGLLGY